MNKSRIIGLSMLILTLFSTNCFASNIELKDYEINETISIENAEEFEKNIPEFIAGELDFLTLQEFGEHMQECPRCKEELVIQFLVTEGMQRLEDGDAFDLQRELEIRLTEAKRKVKIHMSFLKAGAVLEVITVIFLLGFLGWIIS